MADKTITIFEVEVPAATGVGVTWAAQYEDALDKIADRASGVEIKNITTVLWGAPVSGGEYADTPLNRMTLERAGFLERTDTPGIWETPVVSVEYLAPSPSNGNGKTVYRMYWYAATYSGGVYTDISSTIGGASELRIVGGWMDLRQLAGAQSLAVLSASDAQLLRVPGTAPTTTIQFLTNSSGDQLSGYVEYIKDADV